MRNIHGTVCGLGSPLKPASGLNLEVRSNSAKWREIESVTVPFIEVVCVCAPHMLLRRLAPAQYHPLYAESVTLRLPCLGYCIGNKLRAAHFAGATGTTIHHVLSQQTSGFLKYMHFLTPVMYITIPNILQSARVRNKPTSCATPETPHPSSTHRGYTHRGYTHTVYT